MVTDEVQAPVHECKGVEKDVLSEPKFARQLVEGQEYMGQHMYVEIRCSKCDFVHEAVTHQSYCYQGEEYELFGSTWSAKHQAFMFKKGETPSWRHWHLNSAQKKQISDFYRGILDVRPILKVVKNTSF